MIRVGLISDTHGLLRPEALAFLEGSDHIVHGGDICDASVLEALSAIAPVTAVRGNNDHGSWASRLRETELFQVGDIFIYAIHDLAALDIASSAAGWRRAAPLQATRLDRRAHRQRKLGVCAHRRAGARGLMHEKDVPERP